MKLSFTSLFVQQLAFWRCHSVTFTSCTTMIYWVNGCHFRRCYFSSMLWIMSVGIYFQCYEYESKVQDWGARKGGICVGTWNGFNCPQQSIRQAFQEIFLSYIVSVCALFLISTFAFHGCLLLQIVFHNPKFWVFFLSCILHIDLEAIYPG
jgi:hypothetical protein